MKRLALLCVAAGVAAAALPCAAQADESEVSSTIQGITLRPEIGTGSFGYEMTANLGGTSYGLRTREGRKYLLLWDADAELVGGLVVYEHPFYPLYGIQIAGQGEGIYRLQPSEDFSPFVGVGAQVYGLAITQSGVAFGGGNYFNNLDGLAGLGGTLQVRATGGISLLHSDSSLVAGAHLLAEVDSPESNTPGLAFLGGGLHLRYDLPGSLAVIGEATYTTTFSLYNAALQSSTRIGRWTLSANAVKTLSSHFFAGLGISVSRADTDVSYKGGRSYSSDTPVDTRIWLLVGFAL